MNLQGPRCQFGSLTTVKNKGNKDPPNPRDTLVLCPRFSRQGQEWSHGSAFCPFSRVFPTFLPRSPFRWALCASMCLMPLTSHLKARSYERGGAQRVLWLDFSEASDIDSPWEGSAWRHQGPWLLHLHWMVPHFPLTGTNRYWFSGARGMNRDMDSSGQGTS